MRKQITRFIHKKSIHKYMFFLLILTFYPLNFMVISVYSFHQSEEKPRPIAVMVGNSPEERSVQTGLNGADIIYEVPVEFPFTRYMAIFMDNDNTVVGPVRSSRYYFSRISAEWSAIFAHCGGQTMRNEKVFDLDQMNFSLPFWRDQNIGGWINLFTNINKLREEAKRHGISYFGCQNSHPLLNIKCSDTNSNLGINKIAIKYHNDYIVHYEFNQNEKKYYRFVERNTSLEHKMKEKTSVSNIIVQYVDIHKIDHDSLGRIDVGLVGEGLAKIFTEGNYQIAKWMKKDKNDQTLFFSEEGYPILLNPGLTWVHILSPDLNVWFK